MAFIVVYDANVLFPSLLRDLLIRLAQTPLVQAKWTDEILDEVFRALRRHRPDLDEARLERTRQLMCRAIRDCLVKDYEPLIDVLSLPDPADRHVLAAGIKCSAQIIVTANLKDFPAEALSPWTIEARDPDSFLLDQVFLDRQAVYGAVQRIADTNLRDPRTVQDVLTGLEKLGLVKTVAALRTPYS